MGNSGGKSQIVFRPSIPRIGVVEENVKCRLLAWIRTKVSPLKEGVLSAAPRGAKTRERVHPDTGCLRRWTVGNNSCSAVMIARPACERQLSVSKPFKPCLTAGSPCLRLSIRVCACKPVSGLIEHVLGLYASVTLHHIAPYGPHPSHTWLSETNKPLTHGLALTDRTDRRPPSTRLAALECRAKEGGGIGGGSPSPIHAHIH